MSNQQPNQKVSIYVPSGFMGEIVVTRATLVIHGVQDYAQYKDAPFVKFIPRGKRTQYAWQGSYKPYLLILAGWDTPEPEGAMIKSPDGSEESRYASFDDRYVTDANTVLNTYIETHPDAVVADYRWNKLEF